jgi:L-aspartate oxidase
MTQNHYHDALIIGSGAAGLAAALTLAENMSVAILSKTTIKSGSTWLAQGGIAAVLDNEDSVESHSQDTLTAGAGLCHTATVQRVAENGRESILWLQEMGVEFTTGEGQQDLHLTREGGHSHRRVIHHKDRTGKAVSSSLSDRVLGHKNIQVYENRIAIDLLKQADANSSKIRCNGAYALDLTNSEVELHQARVVILATGGASKVYLYSTSPDGASGDGIAMAWRAGCRVANMEFNQFHPTCLYHPKARSFLLSEALRGEGAILKLPNGETFMEKFDDRAELAPRDIVARAIDHEMKRLGCDNVYLDISHRPGDFVKEHFPNIYEFCLDLGIDITKEAIPVVPAAHYTCGGVLVDENGQTDLDNLYAIGEVSFTGMHGANRLASNSLLECIVYARLASTHISKRVKDIPAPDYAKPWDASQVTHSDEDVVISHNWDELRRFMWDYVGIVRTDKRLQRALHRVQILQKEIQDYYSNYRISNDLIELRNLVVVAERIIISAMQRRESRGLHYSLDYPDLSPIAQDTIMVPINFAGQDMIVSRDQS